MPYRLNELTQNRSTSNFHKNKFQFMMYSQYVDVLIKFSIEIYMVLGCPLTLFFS